MADSEILIEVYGTAPAIDSSIDVQQGEPNVIIAAMPVKGDSGDPGPQGPQGPQGEQGDSGPSFEGTAWWYGSGEPQGIVGSKPGDFYFDTATGTVYKLGD